MNLVSADDAVGSTVGIPSPVSPAKVYLPHQFKPGNTISRLGGRPKNRNFREELLHALKEVEKTKRTHFMTRLWLRAFEDDGMALELLSYLLPKPRPSVDPGDSPELTFLGPIVEVNIQPPADVVFPSIDASP